MWPSPGGGGRIVWKATGMIFYKTTNSIRFLLTLTPSMAPSRLGNKSLVLSLAFKVLPNLVLESFSTSQYTQEPLPFLPLWGSWSWPWPPAFKQSDTIRFWKWMTDLLSMKTSWWVLIYNLWWLLSNVTLDINKGRTQILCMVESAEFWDKGVRSMKRETRGQEGKEQKLVRKCNPTTTAKGRACMFPRGCP